MTTQPVKLESGTEVVLDLDHVQKVFKSDLFKKKFTAVSDLTCAFRRGACTGLLGHNGAGKTTAIRLILGLIRADAGTVRFEGRPLDTAAKRRIGYMPEINKLPAGLTAGEILRFHLELHAPPGLSSRAARSEAVEERLQAVGLSEHRNRKVGHLSKGMARRLAWAKATIHKPEMLILDEPASGLDPLGRRQMLNWIKSEKQRGTTILLCTHELDQVSTLCDAFHVLNKGRLVLTSDPEVATRAGGTVRHYSFASRYTLHVSGVDDSKTAQISQQLGAPAQHASDGFLKLLTFDDYGQSIAWTRTLMDEGFVITRFAEEPVISERELLQYFDKEKS